MDTAAQGLLSRDEMESRRLLAAQDLQTGLSQSQVARKFGVSRTTASRGNRTLSGKGAESLRKRRAPGRPSRLTADQLKNLTDTYQAGPRAAARARSPRTCFTRSLRRRWRFPKFRQTWRRTGRGTLWVRLSASIRDPKGRHLHFVPDQQHAVADRRDIPGLAL